MKGIFSIHHDHNQEKNNKFLGASPRIISSKKESSA